MSGENLPSLGVGFAERAKLHKGSMLDQVVITSAQDQDFYQQDVYTDYDEKIQRGQERIDEQEIHELDKTAWETESIQAVISLINQDRQKRGLLPRDLAVESYHKFSAADMEKIHHSAVGDYSHDDQRIRFGETDDCRFLLEVLIHETLHADSYQSLAQLNTDGPPLFMLRRIGNALLSYKDGWKSYFGYVNEAITEGRTQAFFMAAGSAK